jgi:hypothetical protein
MKIICPFCRGKAFLKVEVLSKDASFKNPANDWRVACEDCRAQKEGKFKTLDRIILLLLYLLPIASSWGIFFLYASILGTGWLRLLAFLFHIAAGIYVGDLLNTGYCVRFIFKKHHLLG